MCPVYLHSCSILQPKKQTLPQMNSVLWCLFNIELCMDYIQWICCNRKKLFLFGFRKQCNVNVKQYSSFHPLFYEIKQELLSFWIGEYYPEKSHPTHSTSTKSLIFLIITAKNSTCNTNNGMNDYQQCFHHWTCTPTPHLYSNQLVRSWKLLLHLNAKAIWSISSLWVYVSLVFSLPSILLK